MTEKLGETLFYVYALGLNGSQCENAFMSIKNEENNNIRVQKRNKIIQK